MLRDAYVILEDIKPFLKDYIIPENEGGKGLAYLAGALEAHYNQTFRSYHNLDHIHSAISEWTESSYDFVERPAELLIAILFHDTVYNLRAKSPENERESADVAIAIGPLVFKNIDWQRVYHLIMATVHDGKLANASRDEQAMADIDLAGLQVPLDYYQAMREKVVKEYLTMYSEEEVRQGRIAFLKAMLAREKIYYLHGSETQARINLNDELAWLNENNSVLRY